MQVTIEESTLFGSRSKTLRVLEWSLGVLILRPVVPIRDLTPDFFFKLARQT